MNTILEKQFDKEEYIISMLKEVRDRQDLLQKSDALILSKIAELNDKVDTIATSESLHYGMVMFNISHLTKIVQ